MFKKLLVANRGEIALRLIRTAKELGLQSVAIYSEEDRHSLHVQAADESVCIGPAESRQSYLSIEKILQAIDQTKAEAVHPGYGFLSERAEFAAALSSKGIIFVGPTADQIELMGDKVQARQYMQSLGVPIVPGTGALEDVDEAIRAVEALLKERKDFRFPLLIKSSGGGGGKGMRLVRKPEDLRENLERARSESLQSFGTPRIFVERYIESPRHIEIQVLGDGKSAIHLFERECSLQRRHQKVVEEAPSPSTSESTRKKMCELAADAVRKMKYKSAGTLEFIVSPEEDFYFLEMNTRIQVEHPVTEWITGTDLIREQIRIAQGHELNLAQDQIHPRGHSIEARLYAEDCENQFLPQPGKLHFIRFPEWTAVRVDTTLRSGDNISSHYDPMIAKISAWAPDREQCREKLRRFLMETKVEGLITNRSYLIEILESPFFKEGRYHTGILEDASWREAVEYPPEILAAFCLKDYLSRSTSSVSSPLSAWQRGQLLCAGD